MMLAALLVALSLGPIPTEGPPPAPELKELRLQLVAALNAHRAEYGLPLLAVNAAAEKAAQFQAEDMLRSGLLRHEDSTGRSPMARFSAYGGQANFYGENVGFHSPGVVDEPLLWNVLIELDRQMMAETPPNDGHRKNILSNRYSAVGIGLAVGAKGVFMSEDFLGSGASR